MVPLVKLAFSFLLALAVLVAPAGMFGGGKAMAAPYHQSMTMPADHCAKEGETGKNQSSKISCMMACSAIPTIGNPVPEQPEAIAQLPALPRIAFGVGLDPEAETPPPRLS